MRTQAGISTVAALIAGIASLAVIGLVWLALHYSDERIWLGIGLLMALSPFAMVWRLVRSEKNKAESQQNQDSSNP